MEFRTDKLLHGEDYNPEQWLKRPDILAKDLDMLEESGCNVVSLGIFSWSTLEPEEGVFHFEWLKEKYQTIENLNDQWCTTFWSHIYHNFDQIESPSKIGETQLHALNLDWKRFVTHQTADFIHAEIAAIREGGSTLPTTANLMRSLKGKPFFQMESCPSSTNWQSVSKLKKPGMLFAQSMQAIAHGGEGALYFQIRQSRGASEKFHGAVIDHYGGNDTRVFKEVSKTGAVLKELKELAGTTMDSPVAMIYDWDSQWAMEDSQGPRNKGLHYLEGTPHGLMDVLGIRSTEIDGLYDWEENEFVPVEGNELNLNQTYTCKYLCDLVQMRGAKSLMTYGKDFYAGYAALTVNEYGKGRAWYVAADADKDFFADFLKKILEKNQISCGVKGDIPNALEITVRESEEAK